MASGEEERVGTEESGADETPEEAVAEPGEQLPRRKFLKYAVVGGVAAAAVGIGGAAWLLGSGERLPPYMPNAWTVDYSQVPQRIESQTLKVAQWYDYWPGSFIENFKGYISGKYGVTIDVVIEIYTSNEELFTWITQAGKKFDVMFPTNYTVETMERGQQLLNMNLDWLPNYSHLYDWTEYTDPINRYAVRTTNPSLPQAERLLAVPYQWGTTGLGYRTDKLTREDVETYGLDIMWMNSFQNGLGQTIDLTNKKMMMDDMRETIGQTYKYLGWNKQVGLGYTPTNIPKNPASPYNGEFQWSENETEPAKLTEARDALLAVKPSLYAFNTQNQGPYLVNEIVYIDTAWSGDVMYAIRPHTSSPKPVDYWVPPQGGARWIDNAAIHKSCRNLWLAHEFMNFFLDPVQGARITDWNLYATPNQDSFGLLTEYPQYNYNPKEDERIYAEYATSYQGTPILERCEYQSDLGATVTAQYLDAWNRIKFG